MTQTAGSIASQRLRERLNREWVEKTLKQHGYKIEPLPKRQAPPSRILTSLTTENLILDLVDLLQYHMRFTQPDEAFLIALWILGTYLHQEFTHFPELIITSPEPGCGKSTLLLILDHLAFNSQGVQNSPTPAVVARSSNGTTFIIDEYEDYEPGAKAEIDRILRSAFQRDGGGYTRMKEKEGKKKGYEPEPFKLYGPKVVASIASQQLRLRQRGFEINLLKTTDKPPKFNPMKPTPLAKAIKKHIGPWAELHREDVVKIYDAVVEEQTELQNLIDSRMTDVAYPLLAIAKEASLGSITVALRRFLQAHSDDATEEYSYSPANQLRFALIEFMGDEKVMSVTPATLAGDPDFRRAAGYGFDVRAETIGRDLKKLLGLTSERTSRGIIYEIDRVKLGADQL